MKSILHLLVKLLFRYRSYDTAALKTPGPVLLIPNHVSWLDWLFLIVVLDDDWKFVVSSTVAQTSWVHRKLMLNSHTFPIDPTSPYAVKRMAEYLQTGGRLVLFAEGQITHTGTLMKLFDGTGFLLFKTGAKVITAYLRGADRLRWTRQPGWRRWFPTVTAHFSQAMTPPKLENVRTTEARTKLTNWLRDRMVEHQFQVEMAMGPDHVLKAVIETSARQPKKIVLEDVTGQELSYRKVLVGADLLGRRLQQVIRKDQPRIAVLLPNVNATPVAILGLWSLGKVPAVLNFSTGPAVMVTCLELAGIKQVITSKAFLEKARIRTESLTAAGIELIHLEDLRSGISGIQRVLTLLRHSCFGYHPAMPEYHPDDAAVILFTSGSEGVPKGVELSHRNILANLRQMLAVADIEDGDRVLNALPLFHSFGLTVGTFLGLVRGLYIFLYPSPLHYRIVPSIIYERNCTIFLSTNTFLNGYGRKAHSYDFRSMRYLFAAAEKLQEATAQTWSQKYGVRILEGYGATECSPCVSVNTPLLPRYGSVGRLMPGMEHRIETVPGVEDGGRLFVRGPNIMRGYLNAEANEKFKALGGWYDTGDIVSIDADGFLHIRGRMKRFAKVSGEMVSLTAVEDALAGAFPQYGLRCQIAVVTRPDQDKGEVLIAVSNEPKLQLSEIREAIRAKGLSNLCAPRELKIVREIPKLGTGKVNHRELQKEIMEAGG